MYRAVTVSNRFRTGDVSSSSSRVNATPLRPRCARFKDRRAAECEPLCLSVEPGRGTCGDTDI